MMKKMLIALFTLGLLCHPAIAQEDVMCSSSDSPQSSIHGNKGRITAKLYNKKYTSKPANHSNTVRQIVYPATVIAITGQVQRIRNSISETIGLGQQIQLNDEIKTGHNGFITVRLGDGTINALPPNAHIKLQQIDPYTARYELLNGRVESKVIKRSQTQPTFEIRLPTVSIGVRGTYFNVSYNALTRETNTSVYEGLVQVRQRHTCTMSLLLHANEGARLGTGTAPLTAKPLLSAPNLVHNKAQRDHNDMTFIVQSTEQHPHYRAQIANDADFVDVIREFESKSSTLQLTNDGLYDGFYYIRIMSLDELGIPGQAQQYLFLRNRH